jgi:hypothetical protein
MRIFIILLLFNSFDLISQTFQVDDVPFTNLPLNIMDPEFLPGTNLIVYQDKDNNIYATEINPFTGLLKSSSGKDWLISDNVVRLDSTHQGPEWGLDKFGAAVFFTKYDVNGKRQIWRARKNLGKWSSKQITFATNGAKAAFASLDQSDSISQIGFAEYDRGYLYGAVGYATDSVQYYEIKNYYTPSPGSRWSPTTDEIFYPYVIQIKPDTIIQVASYNLKTNKTTILTNDSGNKIETWAFISPEYNNELLIASQIENDEIAIYRDLNDPNGSWTRIATIKSPDKKFPYIFSFEPVFDIENRLDRTYLTFLAAKEHDNDSEGSLWIVDINPDESKRFARRVDEGAVSGSIAPRKEPEPFIINNEVYLYYNSKGSFRRARTGIFVEDKPSVNIENCIKASEYNRECDGVSMLVMYKGIIIFEDYPTKYHNTNADSAWFIASGTKGFNGIMAARLIQDRFMKSFDELASETIDEWKSDSNKSKITIKHLLSLTSGIDAVYFGQGVKSYSQSITAPVIHEPGTFFQYGPVPFQCFGEVVRRKLLKNNLGSDPLNDYLKPRILDLIDSKPADWKYTNEGDATLPSGAKFNAREWAKFGEFIRKGGYWHGEQIILKEILDSCFIGSDIKPGYGISWWLDSGAPNPITGDIVCVLGAGGQNLYVSRKLGLVVVRQTSSTGAAQDSATIERILKFNSNDFWDILLYGSVPTSVNNQEVEFNRISMYPNPASDYIVINLDKVILSEAKNPLKIYNTLGECVIEMQDVRHLRDVGHLNRINISHLPVGMYFIQLGNYSEKFMVVR